MSLFLFCGLIIQHVGRFRIEPIGRPIDPFKIARLDRNPGSGRQESAQDPSQGSQSTESFSHEYRF